MLFGWCFNSVSNFIFEFVYGKWYLKRINHALEPWSTKKHRVAWGSPCLLWVGSRQLAS
jgi:hypothetical protein